jgi:hypothetical protein
VAGSQNLASPKSYPNTTRYVVPDYPARRKAEKPGKHCIFKYSHDAMKEAMAQNTLELL